MTEWKVLAKAPTAVLLWNEIHQVPRVVERNDLLLNSLDWNSVRTPFNPVEHQEILKTRPFLSLDKGIIIQYKGNKGKNYRLYVFGYNDGTVCWVSKTAFERIANGKGESDRVRRLMEDNYWGGKGTIFDGDEVDDTLEQDGNTDIGPDSSFLVHPKSDLVHSHFHQLQPQTHSLQTQSDPIQTHLLQTQSDPIQTYPPQTQTQTYPPQTQTQTYPPQTQTQTYPPQSQENFFYAFRFKSEIRGIYFRPDGVCDLKLIEDITTAKIPYLLKAGQGSCVPKADRNFIDENIKVLRDPSSCTVKGCVGFQSGGYTKYKVIVLELGNENLKKELQKYRKEDNCTYEGYLLCPWSKCHAIPQFKSTAEDLWKKTYFGCEDDSLPVRLRYETVEPETAVETQELHDGTSRNNKTTKLSLKDLSIKVERLTQTVEALLLKPKL